MRLVHFIARIRFAEGGVVRALIDLAGAQAAAGHEVVVLTLDDADAAEAWRDGGPVVETLPSVRASRDRIARRLHDADILHLHTPWAPANLSLARAARRAGTPYVLTLHGMLDDWAIRQKWLKKRLYLTLFARRLLRDAAFVHCTAQGEREQSEPRLPHRRVRVVPLLCDLRELACEESHDAAEPDGVPRVLFFGRVVPGKGVEMLLDAMPHVLQRVPDAALTIAGPVDDAYRARLRRRAQERGVGERVEFAGLVVGDAKRCMLRGADVAVSLSDHENFGFTLIEALACSTPVVTTQDVATWRDLESSGGAAIVPTAPSAAARAIVDLLTDREQAQAMGRAGREHVLRWLDPERVLAEYITMYEEAQRSARRREDA